MTRDHPYMTSALGVFTPPYPQNIYRVVQLSFTPKIEVFYMLFERLVLLVGMQV